MSILIRKIISIGENKSKAEINFDLKSHLIHGPTDTGKSYIIELFKYLLGSDSKPKDIGYSNGYTHSIIQLTDAINEYSIIRDLRNNNFIITKGYHDEIGEYEELDTTISDFLISLITEKKFKILTKAGTLGNLTASDLRRISIFDEIDTLNKVPFHGSDKLTKTRNIASTSLVISGIDDSKIELVTKTEDRHKAKGQVDWLTQQIEELELYLENKPKNEEIGKRLEEINNDITIVDNTLSSNSELIKTMKNEIIECQKQIDNLQAKYIISADTLLKFKTINDKYDNDLQRLELIGKASNLIPEYDMVECPNCSSSIEKANDEELYYRTYTAVLNETDKIKKLKYDLLDSILELEAECKDLQCKILSIENDKSIKDKDYKDFIEKLNRVPLKTIKELSNEKSELQLVKDKHIRIREYQLSLEVAKSNSKRKKQIVNRDISASTTKICSRVKELLDDWGLAGIDVVDYDDKTSDITINNRIRTSYGKGKRGIFLTAYVYSIMENALINGFPHLGFIIIDSPLVTYKDPKNGSDDPENNIPITVKDKFYSWLTEYEYKGQIIVLENEVPDADMNFDITEFVGNGGASGRVGYYPT